MRILLVTSSNEQSGIWLDELAAPYYTFKEFGADIFFATPKGGKITLDPRSVQTSFTEKFMEDSEASWWLDNAMVLSDVDAEDFDTVFLTGGHGPLWDLHHNRKLNMLLRDFNRALKPIAAVGHAVVALVTAKDKDGIPLLEGKQVTAYSRTEVVSMKLAGVVPFLLEDKLKDVGAMYSKTANFQPHVVVDGNIITGQNPASSVNAAEALIEQLEVKYYDHFTW